MARLPTWRDQQPRDFATPVQNWGNGVDPIHQKRAGNETRNLTGGTYSPAPTGLVSGEWDEFGYDVPSTMPLGFMESRPNWGDTGRSRAVHLPSWGTGFYAGPEGTRFREKPDGRNPREGETQQVPRGIAGEGWRHKLTSFVLNSVTADPSQLQIRTSNVQRDLSKDNNRAVTRGTDKPRTEIASRIPGMRVKVYSGGQRHEDMRPREHSNMYRAWRFRGIGVAPHEYDEVNSMYAAHPITREVPPDVDQGPPETGLMHDDVEPDEWWY